MNRSNFSLLFVLMAGFILLCLFGRVNGDEGRHISNRPGFWSLHRMQEQMRQESQNQTRNIISLGKAKKSLKDYRDQPLETRRSNYYETREKIESNPNLSVFERDRLLAELDAMNAKDNEAARTEANEIIVNAAAPARATGSAPRLTNGLSISSETATSAK